MLSKPHCDRNINSLNISQTLEKKSSLIIEKVSIRLKSKCLLELDTICNVFLCQMEVSLTEDLSLVLFTLTFYSLSLPWGNIILTSLRVKVLIIGEFSHNLWIHSVNGRDIHRYIFCTYLYRTRTWIGVNVLCAYVSLHTNVKMTRMSS